jgi:hypothetical protein
MFIKGQYKTITPYNQFLFPQSGISNPIDCYGGPVMLNIYNKIEIIKLIIKNVVKQIEKHKIFFKEILLSPLAS